MVDAAVEECPVVGDQQKALFAAEIAADQSPSRLIEMVGRLVDQQKAVFAGKEHRQQNFGLLAAGKRGKWPVQQLLRQFKRRKLPQEAPLRHVRADALQQVDGILRRIRYGVGKIVEAHACVDRALIGVFSLQKPQKRGFAAAVAADQSQPPVGVQLKADVFKDVVIAAVIAERKVSYLNNGHGHASDHKKWLRETDPTAKKRILHPQKDRA